MNKEFTLKDRRALSKAAHQGSLDKSLWADAENACRQIAPLWPLKDFVAVNPMLGQVEERFEDAAAKLSRTTGAGLLLKPDAYAAMINHGEIEKHRLDDAIAHLGCAPFETAAGVSAALNTGVGKGAAVVKTIADLAATVSEEDWSAFAVDQISFWASSYFDEGQSTWKNPWRDESPFSAWRNQAMIDRTPEIMGLSGFRSVIAALPDDPVAALSEITSSLAVPSITRAGYFHRLLSTIAGWAGYRRYQGWRDELHGGGPSGVIDLLAIRAAYDYAIRECLESKELDKAWRISISLHLTSNKDSLRPSLIAQTASEFSYQEKLLSSVSTRSADDAGERPTAQAVFCIDVRSERMRRAIESVNPDVETFGFAGFFGFPIELVRSGDGTSQEQCPVLLEPQFAVCETPNSRKTKGAIRKGAIGFGGAWKRFKTGAISSFAFVESLGGAFAGALLRDAARQPAKEKLPLGDIGHMEGVCSGRRTGMTLEEKVETARGALAGMSFNGRFARLVALVGHGSTTTNNPYAAGLDCGACGGHSGEANARVAASVLNEQAVRAKLAETGTSLPEDTIFIAALHDTTTDNIQIHDEENVPDSHAQDLACLKRDFIDASRAARRDRAPSLGVANDWSVDRQIDKRSRDWSEVRPEWGLAGCAAFIAAPRSRTRGADLEGRTFLHSYNWRADTDNSILELIMTAPLVVASWISLQYYGSSVDNRAYGSGDKTLHNVVGGIGVLEGAGGDLRSGLPMQSVHDGETQFHQPLRLTAVIEAPTDHIDAVLEKHANVRALFDNDWLHLIAITQDGAEHLRYVRGGQWAPIKSDASTATKSAA